MLIVAVLLPLALRGRVLLGVNRYDWAALALAVVCRTSMSIVRRLP